MSPSIIECTPQSSVFDVATTSTPFFTPVTIRRLLYGQYDFDGNTNDVTLRTTAPEVPRYLEPDHTRRHHTRPPRWSPKRARNDNKPAHNNDHPTLKSTHKPPPLQVLNQSSKVQPAASPQFLRSAPQASRCKHKRKTCCQHNTTSVARHRYLHPRQDTNTKCR